MAHDYTVHKGPNVQEMWNSVFRYHEPAWRKPLEFYLHRIEDGKESNIGFKHTIFINGIMADPSFEDCYIIWGEVVMNVAGPTCIQTELRKFEGWWNEKTRSGWIDLVDEYSMIH